MSHGFGSADSAQEHLNKTAAGIEQIDQYINRVNETEPAETIEAFQELDKVYSAVKATAQAGRGKSYNLIEGLKFLSPNHNKEKPGCSKKTWYNWLEKYQEAGLIHTDNQTNRKGEMIIETTDRLEENVFNELEINTGDVYRMLSTQGYNTTEANNGGKIKAFLMYPAGFGHTDIYDQEQINPDTARTLAENLQGTLYQENNTFTEAGRSFGEIMLEQMKNL